MTGFAVVRRIDMSSAFTDGDGVVMTTHTSSNHLSVICSGGGNRCPGLTICVTRFADISGSNMVCASAGGFCTIVTHYAKLTSKTVVKHRYEPIGSTGMAAIAFQYRGNVIRTQAGSLNTVVTRRTSAGGLGMIDRGVNRRPDSSAMASFANIGGGDVLCASAGSNVAVVTFNTGLAYHCNVIKGKHPGGV